MRYTKAFVASTLFAATLLAVNPAHAGKKVWITVGDQTLSALQGIAPSMAATASVKAFQPVTLRANEGQGEFTESVHLVEVDSDMLPQLALAIHTQSNRCVGYMAHSSRAEGLQTLVNFSKPFVPTATTRPTYVIDKQAIVTPMLAQMQASNIGQTIVDLSAHTNRDYKTQSGVTASNWLKQRWTTLGAGRSDFTVEQFTHSGFPMKSVIATIKGTDKASEVIVLSGHLDTINMRDSSENNVAPGADDDASGVAAVTEVLRVMVATGYKPRRTIKFMAYSGEERGLLGSKDIAASFKSQGVNMVGMMQLDMTEFKGNTQDLWIFDDMTDKAQNTFVANIIKTYLPTLTVSHDVCGYACSDHASWYNNGYVASQVHEASFSNDNKMLHTPNDTYAYLKNQATNTLKFARMTAAYAVELGSEGAAAGGTPAADFSFVAKGLAVTFTDKSTDTGGTIGSYAWNFGDGSTGNTASPSHTYAKAGTYSVALTVTDSANQKTSTKTQSVVVSGAGGTGPVASFTFAPLKSPAHTIKFTDTSTTSGGATIATRAWDFGDGKKAKTPKPNHTYAKAGTYSVSETVTDSNGKSATKTASVVVK